MSRIQKVSPSDAAVVFNDLEKLKIVVDCMKAEGKSVCLANGTFDLIHVGHIRMLKDAKSRCDYLIVALNSDTSVKRYKGSHLPIQCEADRMEIISALRFVDYVARFDEPTADTVIAYLKPTIVAKGTDYSLDSVPERDTVFSYGGQIVICGDAKGDKGSSKIIQRIQKASARPASKKVVSKSSSLKSKKLRKTATRR